MRRLCAFTRSSLLTAKHQGLVCDRGRRSVQRGSRREPRLHPESRPARQLHVCSLYASCVHPRSPRSVRSSNQVCARPARGCAPSAQPARRGARGACGTTGRRTSLSKSPFALYLRGADVLTRSVGRNMYGSDYTMFAPPRPPPRRNRAHAPAFETNRAEETGSSELPSCVF